MPSHYDTLQLHAGQDASANSGNPRAVPIYATSSYVFKNSQHGADLFGLNTPGYLYSRMGNPTVDVLEKRLAALEGGRGCVAVASGQAAQAMALGALAQVGDNIVTSSHLYGGTYNQLKVAFKRLGVEVRFSEGGEAEDYEQLFDDKTKALYVESIGNPKYTVPDFEKITEVAHKHGIPVVVDNTFGAAGFFCKPIEFGADIITHSATKWINGHGTAIAGAIVDSGNFPWTQYPDKFPQFSQPAESYHGMVYNDNFGPLAFIAYVRLELLRDLGSTMSPFTAFLSLQGLETLSLRCERHARNSIDLARHLEDSPYVAWVSYPGLDSHPSRNNAKKYLTNGAGGMLSFGIKPFDKTNGEEEASEVDTSVIAAKFVDSLKLASNLANVGDSKTLVIAPYFTTHQQLTDEEKLKAGADKDVIRVSVGTEYIDDIIADFEQAFKTVYQS
ncbi:bifunctional cysteine synthase/O-acetylhomoserine aminocarboxypropyltransferase MET17 Ecym_8365 [Eremothecium cymbalariae DBVPG|uniref:O-acetylhomoserine (Thiol)-lyase n=1 Tax=Eremothecium cymbalariae (strain CBS 270.75 / DBVPG 7215 / KCTC 17166 / NRRL Y-17582) TaxID=931890 RepID=G8JXR4_ERECY|nr:Hypothetical protein Ecym_8365 [Eremothecium cymbalariae DBVPG\